MVKGLAMEHPNRIWSRTWNPAEIEAGLRALVWTLAPFGGLSPEIARLVDAVQHQLGTSYDVNKLARIDHATLAKRLVDPWLRTQLVRAVVVGLFLDRNRSWAGLDRVEKLARALGVVEPAIGDLELFLAGKKWRLRRRVISRMWVIEHLKARIA